MFYPSVPDKFFRSGKNEGDDSPLAGCSGVNPPLRASLEARNPAGNPAFSRVWKPTWNLVTGQIAPPFGSPREGDAAFLFLYFLKMFFTEIYFRFHILQFYTPTARQGGGRDLHVNKYNFFCAEAHGGSLPSPCRTAGTCRPVEGRQAARPAGRLPPKYKSWAPSLASSFSVHEIQRGERERGGVREVIPPVKPCGILNPNRS